MKKEMLGENMFPSEIECITGGINGVFDNVNVISRLDLLDGDSNLSDYVLRRSPPPGWSNWSFTAGWTKSF